MVKNTLFVMTHVGSGWEKLCTKLEQDSRFHCFCTGNKYRHPDDVRELTNLPHRKNNALAVWVDVIVQNEAFCMKRLCPYYKFLFWSSSFELARTELCSHSSDWSAERYYNFRIAGMKQYYARTKCLWNPNLQDDLFFATVLG